MKKYMFLFAAAAMMLTACNNDEPTQDAVQVQPNIEFAPEWPGDMTRAASDITMISNEPFYIWADQVTVDETQEPAVVALSDQKPIWFNAWKILTANPATRFKYGNTTQKWPATNSLRFYAIHGNFSGDNSTISEDASPFPMTQAEYTTIQGWGTSQEQELLDKYALYGYNEIPATNFLISPVHSVATDQTEDESYVKSDLLYGVIGNSKTTTTALPLKFYHMLSKIVVKLTVGVGITKQELLTDGTVTLANVKYKVAFLPTKLQITGEETDLLTAPTDLATLSVREAMLTPQDDLGNILLNTKVNLSTDENQVTESAIIVPQTFDSENTVAGININWSGRNTLIPFAGRTFESGKVYTFNITVDHKGTSYGFNPTVTGWGDEEERAIDVKPGTTN